MAAGAKVAMRITDKMPGNFSVIGLIHLALPKARIIHTTRDPIDTCPPCFSKLFSQEQPFTYDLAELGRYYRAYQRLMDHWHSVLPEGALLDVRTWSRISSARHAGSSPIGDWNWTTPVCRFAIPTGR
jgi:Sulfotransferase family